MAETTAPLPTLAARRGDPRPSARTGMPPAAYLWILIVFLVLEYVRPPVIVQLRLQMLISLAFPLLWLSARDRPHHPILAAQLLFLGLCALSVPLARNNYAAYMVTRVMFGNVAIALALSWILSWRPYFLRGMWAWVAIMTYVAFFGLTHGGTGPGGFLGDENDLALACVTALPFAFFGFEQLGGWRRWVCAGMGVLMVSAVVASFSRGGFVALAGVGLYCYWASRHKGRNLLVLVAAVAAFLVFAPASYIEEIKTIRNTDEGTADARQFLWITAYNMWQDHPVIGVGGGNYNFYAGEYQPRDDPRFQKREYLERNWYGQTVHSLYFQILAEQGIAGIALCGFIGFAHLRLLRRLRRDVRNARGAPPELRRDAELYGGALASAMVGFAVAGIFLSVASYPYLWYFSALAVALDAALRRELAALPDGQSRAEAPQRA